MPGRLSLSLLLAELMDTPLMVARAFCAVCEDAMPLALPTAKARRERPLASVLLPSSSATVMRKPFSRPVSFERTSRRSPLASLSTVALTPASASLILAAISVSVSSPALIVTATGVPAPAVKLLPLQLPSSMVMLPVPMAVSAATALDAVDCALASCCTVMVSEVAGAPAVTVTPMALGLDEVALTAFQPLAPASLPAASPRAVICDLMVP
ncbi:hypothetical protein D9M68_574920 [compost metagenome]